MSADEVLGLPFWLFNSDSASSDIATYILSSGTIWVEEPHSFDFLVSEWDYTWYIKPTVDKKELSKTGWSKDHSKVKPETIRNHQHPARNIHYRYMKPLNRWWYRERT